jgi:hypothetical protein
MPPLVPCSGCRRHIRIDHATCPFCAADVPADFAKRVIPAPARRLDRFALITFTTALSVAACGAVADDDRVDGGGDRARLPPTQIDSGSPDLGGPVPMYGAPSFDAGVDAKDGSARDSSASDAGPADDGAIAVMYGIAVFDAGLEDDGAIGTLYGLPIVDGGELDQ